MSIAQFTVVGLFTDREPLLKGQAVVLCRAHLVSGGVANGDQIVLVQAGLFGELLAVALVLNLPSGHSRSADRRGQQHANG